MSVKPQTSPWWCPSPQISGDQLKKFLTDPEIVTLELLFLTFTVSYVFVMWGILQWVWPAPVLVTWFQLLTGFIMAWIFGEAGRDFPSSAFFPPLSVSKDVIMPLMLPIMSFLAMTVSTNAILMGIPSIAYYPVVAALAVVTHHATRFFGCGQVYMPVRWLAVVLMLASFIAVVSDKHSGGPMMLALGVCFAIFSSAYRGCFLEKAMHVVQGNGNVLHNNQNVVGILLLPFVSAAFMEHRAIAAVPYKFNQLYTWQYWGCLVSAGMFPFAKNIIANRLIRRTGQGPWRMLELLSIVVICVLGSVIDKTTVLGSIATVMMLTGRLLGSMDALSIEPLQVRQKDQRDEEIQRQLLEYAEMEEGVDSDEQDQLQSASKSNSAVIGSRSMSGTAIEA